MMIVLRDYTVLETMYISILIINFKNLAKNNVNYINN